MEDNRTVSEEEFQRIIEICQDKLTQNPNDPEIWTRLGMALMGLNQQEEAISSFKEALKIDEEYEWALNNLPMSLFSAGRYRESLDAFDTALKLNTEDEVL